MFCDDVISCGKPATSSPVNMEPEWGSIKQSPSTCGDIDTCGAGGGPEERILGSGCVGLPWIGEVLLLWQEYQVPTLLLLLQYTYYYSSCHYIEGINKPGVQIEGTNKPGVE